MLKQCPECQLQVSDKAITCPHCGYPLIPSVVRKSISKKRRRLPNGFGDITLIKNKALRKPYRAMITVGKTKEGKCIRRILKPQGYFETYNDAYLALLEYNKSPYDLNDVISMSELYNRWSSDYFKSLKSNSSIRTITSAWKYCWPLYDLDARTVRVRHLKECIDTAYLNINNKKQPASANTKSRIKSLFNLMFDYAVEYEIVDKNYARMFSITNDVVTEMNEVYRGHLPFTNDEIEILWKNIDVVEYVDLILVQCYTGMRPGELGKIEMTNVFLDDNYLTGGIKTISGINRIIPIHKNIKPIIEKAYLKSLDSGNKYLFMCTDNVTHKNNTMLTYDKYATRFRSVVKELGLNPKHRPHDPRMHFITTAKKYNVDEYAIKRIVGHAIVDLTERVYTKRNIDWLCSEIGKIK